MVHLFKKRKKKRLDSEEKGSFVILLGNPLNPRPKCFSVREIGGQEPLFIKGTIHDCMIIQYIIADSKAMSFITHNKISK